MRNDKITHTVYSLDKDVVAIACHEPNPENEGDDKVTTYSMLSSNWNSIESDGYKCPEKK